MDFDIMILLATTLCLKPEQKRYSRFNKRMKEKELIVKLHWTVNFESLKW